MKKKPEIETVLETDEQHPVMPKTFRRTYIREWRQHRGLTLEQLADRLEMTPSHLSMLERGQRGYAQETLEALAHALQTDAGSLLMQGSPPGQATAPPGDMRHLFLREHRKARGVKAAAMAKMLGVDRVSIYRLESGTRGINSEKQIAYATALGINPEQLWSPPGQATVPQNSVRFYLAEWREHRGLTQQQLANRLGVTGVTVSRWETGQRQPDWDAEADIAKALNADPVDLRRHPDHPSADALLRDQPDDVRELAIKLIKAILR